ILKKPFDTAEVRQVACALTEKWRAHKKASLRLSDLQRMVEERTQEIERARDELVQKNTELVSARRRADAANRAKSEFLANMSHETRTPMHAILGNAELLSDEPQNPLNDGERRESLAAIKRNGEHLAAILDDILDLSKIEAGELKVE